jgi:threonine/homoserine/homoserine lactone efflux protein
LGLVGVATLVIVTPGPDTALTIRNALLGGRAAGVATAAGVALGLARTAPAPGDGDALRRPRIRRALDAVMDATLVALGVRVVAER